MIFSFIFIFFINFSSYLSAIIIIPFQTYNPLLIKDEKFLELIKRASDQEIVETISRNLVYTELNIGMEKGKKQKIITFIEMGNYDLYFVDLNHHTGLPPLREIKNSNFSYNNNYLLNNIFKLNFYNSSLSETYQYVRSCPEYLEDYYYDRDVFGKEQIYLKQKNKTTYKEKYEPIIFYANFKEYEEWDHRPGVIGFEKGDSEIIRRLKKLKIIKNYDWNIKYTDYLGEKGEIIIGDLPHIYDKKNYDEDNLRVANVTNGHHQWSLVFDHIYLESNNTKIKYNYKGKYEIGKFFIEEFFILGTNEYFALIENIFFSKYISENICQKQTHKKLGEDNEYYHFMCYLKDNKKLKEFLNNFPSLIFYQGEMDFNFTLDSNDLFTIFPDNNRVLFNVEFYNSSNSWVLGKPFFKKYQLNFNSEENLISYYTNNANSNNYNKKNNVKINFIIFFMFFFAFLFFLKVVFCKYNRKLRANELEDNYNYISNNDNEKELN